MEMSSIVCDVFEKALKSIQSFQEMSSLIVDQSKALSELKKENIQYKRELQVTFTANSFAFCNPTTDLTSNRCSRFFQALTNEMRNMKNILQIVLFQRSDGDTGE